MTPLAWIAAVAIGLSLGLLGSGGSILTVPALVFLVHLSDHAAITASLAVVGAIATVGSVMAATRRSVDWRTVLLFTAGGIPGTAAGTWLTRFAGDGVQLVTFAIVLLGAAWYILRTRQTDDERAAPACRHCAAMIATHGAGVGVLTGFVGVGGGFLIVPALVVLGGLAMRHAVGSSLVVIALNSWIGFAAHVRTDPASAAGLDWGIVLAFSAVGMVGSLAGQLVTEHLPQAVLKRAFGVLLLLVGGTVLWRAIPQAF